VLEREGGRLASGSAGAVTLARFLARPDEPHSRLRVRRHMRAEGLGRRAFLDARVELDPEEGFRFQVEAEGGSRLFLDRILRASLAKEQEIYAQGIAGRSALTALNYTFSFLAAEEGQVHLRAVPRRRETSLFDGVVVVASESADLLRIEGRLARSPSIWVPTVEVVRHFRRLQGHRVPVRLESVARVRFFGDVCVVMDFEYEMVDGDLIAAVVGGPGGTARGETPECPSHPADAGSDTVP
jgi:hypothetical protein